MTRHPSSRAFARLALVVALASFLAGRASAVEPQGPAAAASPAVATPAAPGRGGATAPPATERAALHACSQRADLLFVRKCLQACMIDSKTSTRVMQQSREREECQLRCGHQPEMAAFVQACVDRAARATPVAARAGR